MKANKKTMFAAALAIAVIALAGVGYAATYHAVTVNSGNAAQSAYIVADQSSYNAILSGTVDFDTLTDATHQGALDGDTTKPYYVIPGGTTTIGTTGFSGKSISEERSITVTPSNVAATSYTLDVACSDTTKLNSGWHFYVAVTDNAETQYVDLSSPSQIDIVLKNNAVTVQLFIAGTPLNLTSYTGYNTMGSSTTYDGAASLVTSVDISFTFTAATAPAP